MSAPQAAKARVALVTCAELPGLDEDETAPIAPLAARGVLAEPVVWDDPAVDWDAYDLAVIRSAWDYAGRRAEFTAWAERVPRLANPADVVRWNTDKSYLRDLAAAGVPVVDTTWLDPDSTATLPTSGEYVVKPAVSSGARNTGRYDMADSAQRALAAGLATKLIAEKRTVMVQPYQHAVDTAGETAVLFLGGHYSHAIRKGAMLTGPASEVGLYKEEEITTRSATDSELHVAQQALAAVPGGARRLLYARVDLVPNPDGHPVVLELELTEPSLFLRHDEGAPERFADAVVAYMAR
ncbi:ATP-grasp domain-containing protein [Yinghuangia sp. YIM S09857]|uniref:ATP-grasp domain-containing protein n=1 Tax=Yinghuangia sp. YIM S09857 TaxID=3436929 RepID=UPI003F52CBB4